MKRTPLLMLALALGCGAAPLPPVAAHVEEVDSDHDGVVDARDRCRCRAEDVDGFEDEDGCPDLDNDSDRLADACDLCPNDPETYNGICDEDGCPDRSVCYVESAPITIVDRIVFAARRAEVAGDARFIVEAVAQTLLGNPQVEHVEVVGHAEQDEPRRLAAARARVVVAMLVSMGVAPERLSPLTETSPAGRDVSFRITRSAGEEVDAQAALAPHEAPPPQCGAPPSCPASPDPIACDEAALR